MKSIIMRTTVRSTMPILVSCEEKLETAILVNTTASVYAPVNFKNEIPMKSNMKKPYGTPIDSNFYAIGSHVFQSVVLVRYCSTTPI